MRLFTAIDLPNDVRDRLAALIGRLRPAARLKWSTAGNLHVTTKFIGEWPAGRLAELTATLRGVPGGAPIAVSVRGLGWFPNARASRVFWAGVEGGSPLEDLARATDLALSGLGIAREDRPFSPHLTLARIKDPVPLDRLRDAVSALPSVEFGQFTADRFSLYQSKLGPSGSVYSKLEEFALTT
ncbi:MAG TPA: RNA 2',3'-cyclic phosphodiesterase [Bryobacteraceae bacterium]|nr:RNA 2',3'-cyclic phosphodiesterase [Bryobacteraceae bacterium]